MVVCKEMDGNARATVAAYLLSRVSALLSVIIV